MPGVADAGAIADAGAEADSTFTQPSRADGGDAGIATCKVTVAIKLSAPVACPGHPLEIDAVGTPSGGTYTWTVSGAELDNDSGDSVNLRSFQPDDAAVAIPEQQATVRVTYKHPNGTAQDSQTVKIHKIEFRVTSPQPKLTNLFAREDDVGVSIENEISSVDALFIQPEVTIHIDKSCPRKQECARNHRAGWIQDITQFEKTATWRHHKRATEIKTGLPVRDGVEVAEFPFYADVFPFQLELDSDTDTEKAAHYDSPGQSASWSDPQSDNLTDALQQVVMKMKFTAWLVVQNVEWSEHDLPGSFLFLKNLKWSVDHTVAVDLTQPIGGRCSPPYSQPKIEMLDAGKGDSSPCLTEKVASQVSHANWISLDAPAHPPAHRHHPKHGHHK